MGLSCGPDDCRKAALPPPRGGTRGPRAGCWGQLAPAGRPEDAPGRLLSPQLQARRVPASQAWALLLRAPTRVWASVPGGP